MKFNFGIFDGFFGKVFDKKTGGFVPSGKRKDIDYELEEGLKNIESEGHLVLEIKRNMDEIVVIYQRWVNKELEDEIDIAALIISKKGIWIPHPHMIVHREESSKSLHIADIKIKGDCINKGYGSLMMSHLLKKARNEKNEVYFITGVISSVDADHIDRLLHFYKKHGFLYRLDESITTGQLLWINDEITLTNEQIDIIFNQITFFGLKNTIKLA
ncbi:GNAT family N-acetyltransferase [Aneurinibacillus aneurinilyticus]|uniref:GNAT family N-acetyltransferase n=1 Tax=Aneurinibacillus aneurinilyticus TaxID=1391 RepID=UPI003523DCBC